MSKPNLETIIFDLWDLDADQKVELEKLELENRFLRNVNQRLKENLRKTQEEKSECEELKAKIANLEIKNRVLNKRNENLAHQLEVQKRHNCNNCSTLEAEMKPFLDLEKPIEMASDELPPLVPHIKEEVIGMPNMPQSVANKRSKAMVTKF